MNRPPPLSIVSVAKVKEKKGRKPFTEQMINPKCENGNKVDFSISVAADDEKDQQGNVLFDLDENNKDTTTASQPSVAVGGRPRSVQLPWKLHRILQYCREEGLEDIMSWDTTGKTFQIYNKARFEVELMPRFFDTNKFKSFQRSLNLWGFYIRNRGNKSGPNQTTSDSNDGMKTSNVSSQPSQEQGGECYHPYFVRGRPDLCHRMLRIKKKTQKTRSKNKKSNNSSFISDKSLEQREALRKTLLGINVSTGLSSTTPVHSSVGRSCNNKVQSEQVVLPLFPERALGLQTFSGGINSLSMSSSSFPACSSVASSMGINKILVKMLTPRNNNDNSLVNSRSTWNGNLLACPRLCNGSMLQHYDGSNDEANARTLLDLASSSFSQGRPSIVSTGAPIPCDAFVTALTGTRGLGNSRNRSNLSDHSRSAVDLSPFLMEASHMSPRHLLLLLDFAAQGVGR